MCLDTITAHYDPPLTGEVLAWKVIAIYEGPYSPFEARPLKFHKWHKNDINVNICYDWNQKLNRPIHYKSGFHVFTNRTHGELLVRKSELLSPAPIQLIRVIVRNISAKGTQHLNRNGNIIKATCLVAQEIYCFTTADIPAHFEHEIKATARR
jgi:hypothetical protein